ncbi:VgrG-related protein [Streptomyces montanisoli]|uniref:VgrG-related protein n=1 Tax=Streptomyces montanisoli TaxID=2798581 RepID=A0A940RYZ4_9ACTN|nr:VgrG-related protein [Streptomyces montanisoli]MBP0461871.1 VgrG-related protein [Streptomyces montanisoli]
MPPLAFSSVIDVHIGGAKLPKKVAEQLVGAWVDLGAGVPGAFELVFRDQHRKVLKLGKIKIGSDVVLSPVSDGKGAHDPLLTGEVTALETDYDGKGTFTVVRGYDLGHRLLRRRRVFGFPKMSATEMVQDILGDHGIPKGKMESTGAAYDFVTQDNITDWDFIARLADENDKLFYLDPHGKFQFVARENASGAPPESTPSDKSPLVLQAGHDVKRCRAGVTSADQVPEVRARGWNVDAKQTLKSTAGARSNDGFKIGTTPGKVGRSFKGATLVETSTPYDKIGRVERAAKSLADDVTSSFAELEVTVRGNPRLRPDTAVTLKDVGDPFEGKYTVTGARHVFASGRPYETLVTVSGRQWRSLYGLASGGTSAAPRLPSVANALVTDTKDPLKQGRVKLEFPWLDDKYVSDWTRVVQYGGVDGGSIMPLDVKDEVLVAFDRGALDHPYVIGGLYNGKDHPKRDDVPLHDRLSGKASRHTISDREFNRMDLLSERTGLRKQGVRLSTGDGNLVINMDRTKTEITVDSRGGVTIKGNRSVSVEAGANLSLKAGGMMNLNAGGEMSIQSGGAMTIGSTAMQINARAALSISSEAEANIESTAMQIVGGADLAILAASILLETGDPATLLANGMPVV